MYVIIKLRSGEEVLGKMSIETEGSILIEDALILRYGYSDDGVPSVFFEKYCLFTQSFDVTFANNLIDHIYKDPMTFVIEYYNRSLSSMKKRYAGMAGKKRFDQEPRDSNELQSLQKLYDIMTTVDKKKVH